MPYLKAGEVIKVLSAANGQPFSHRTLSNWIETGVITPVVEPGGQGNPRVFSIVDVLSIAAGRGLRSTGEYTMEAAGNVMRAIRGYSEERLLSDFAAGKTCLVFLGDYVCPRLLNEDEAREAAEEFVAQHPEMFKVTGLRPQAIDIAQVYRNILRVIEDGENAGKGQKPKVTA